MTIPVRLSVALQSNKTPNQYVAQAMAIDRFGFDTVSVYNDLFFQPALGPLLLMAPHLRSARLGPAALNPYTLHPIEIAGQIAVLDMVTDGRAYLGLVRGAWLDRLDVPQPHPIQTLREAVALVRHLFAGHTDGFAGDIFRIPPGDTFRFPVRRAAIPITIGTWGARTARLAGEVADEVKIGGSANPAQAIEVRRYIAQGELSAGRPAGSVGICLGAVTVVDEDRAQARARARHEVALYAPVVAPLDPSLRDADWLARIAPLAQRGDRAEVARLIPDDALDRLAFAGSPADITRQVEDLVGAGVSRVEFGTPHGLDALEGLGLLGERVLPSFRA